MLKMLKENNGYEVARGLGFQPLLASGGFDSPSPPLLPNPTLEPTASVTSPSPSPPKPSTPCVVLSASVSLEEGSFQDTAQLITIETPGPLFDPGANSTMVRSIKRKRDEPEPVVMKIRRTETSWLIQSRRRDSGPGGPDIASSVTASSVPASSIPASSIPVSSVP